MHISQNSFAVLLALTALISGYVRACDRQDCCACTGSANADVDASKLVAVFASGTMPNISERQATQLRHIAIVARKHDPNDVSAIIANGIANFALNDVESADRDFRHAVKLDPRKALSWTSLASFLRLQNRPDDAVCILTRALSSGLRDSTIFAGRALAYFDKGEIEPAKLDMIAAIRHNPDDVGRHRAASRNRVLSIQRLEHGQSQVEQMLRDRPAMSKYLTRGDMLWNWAIRKFAGEDSDGPIDWNADDPAPFDGYATPASDASRATIQIAPSNVESPKDAWRVFNHLWSVAVFELSNVKCFAQWQQLNRTNRLALRSAVGSI